MIGAVLVVVAMIVVLPLALTAGGALWSAVLGWSLSEDAEARYAGTEYVRHRSW